VLLDLLACNIDHLLNLGEPMTQSRLKLSGVISGSTRSIAAMARSASAWD
jgi:hypothetical protein